MTKKINLLTIVGVMSIAALLSLSITTNAFAREDDDSNDDRNRVETVQRQEGSDDVMKGEATQLRVEPSGEFKASGIVVNTNSAGVLNVKLFGISFNINAANARIEGGATTTAVSDIAVGDKLSVSGTIDSATGVISARQIVDRTLEARRTGDVRNRIAELMRLVEQLREELQRISR